MLTPTHASLPYRYCSFTSIPTSLKELLCALGLMVKPPRTVGSWPCLHIPGSGWLAVLFLCGRTVSLALRADLAEPQVGCQEGSMEVSTVCWAAIHESSVDVNSAQAKESKMFCFCLRQTMEDLSKFRQKLGDLSFGDQRSPERGCTQHWGSRMTCPLELRHRNGVPGGRGWHCHQSGCTLHGENEHG